MAEEVAALSIRLEATTARLERNLDKASRQFARFSSQIERGADNVNSRLSNVGARFPQAMGKVTKSAKDSANVFEREFARAANAFDQVEAQVDPAAGALRRYEAAQETVNRAVKLGIIDQQRSVAILRQLETQYTLTNRAATGGARAYRNVGAIAQQAGFQVGDFAVQVAGGTNAVTAFSQQGSQLLGFFGPLGAAIGAAVAVLGALIIAFGDSTSAAEALEGAIDDLSDASSELDRINGDLEQASGDVKDALLEERDAALALAEAKIKAGEAAVAAIRAEVEARAAADLSATFRRRQLEAGTVDEFTGFEETDPQAQIRAGLGDELAAAEQEIINGDLELRKALANAEATLAAARDRLGGGDGLGGGAEGAAGRNASGGGGRSRRGSREREDQLPAAVADVELYIDALRREIAVIGEVEARRQELEEALAAERLERELLAAAAADGTEANEAEREQIDALVALYRELIRVKRQAQEEDEERKEQAEAVKEDIEELSSEAADAIAGLIDGTLSWNEALKAVLSTMIEIARQNLLDMNEGKSGGLLGSIFGSIIGGVAGGIGGGFSGALSNTGNAFGAAGSLFTSSGAIALPTLNANGNAFIGGKVTPFANGGIVDGPTLFPMKEGAGLMGEAGPEAIMPLERGPDGKLGVRSSGNNRVQNISVNINTPDANSFRRSEGQIQAQIARMISRADGRNN